MITLIFSLDNTLSRNIFNLLQSKGHLVNEEKTKDYTFYDFTLDHENNICKAVCVKDYLYLTNEDVSKIQEKIKDKCEFLIISTHRSETQKIDTISIHVCGNFNKNELGGEKQKLSLAYLDAFDFLYKAIAEDKEKPNTLEFFIEATHHGPSLDIPVLYYEIGPNDNAYNNKEYQEYYIKKLIEYLTLHPKTSSEHYVLIGAPHYLDTKMVNNIKAKMKEKNNKDNVFFSHIIPKYSLNDILELSDNELENIFTEVIDKSQTEKLILNKEYMKSLTRITSILDNLKKNRKKGIDYYII